MRHPPAGGKLLLPACLIHYSHGFRIVLAEFGQVNAVGFEFTPAFQQGTGRDTGLDWVFLVIFGIPCLSLIADQILQQFDGVILVLGGFGDSRTTDINMCTAFTFFLVRPENGNLFSGCLFFGIVARFSLTSNLLLYMGRFEGKKFGNEA